MPSEQAPDHLFQLTKEQREFYHTEGYLVIDNFYSKTQSENLAKLVEELAAWPEVSGKYMKYHEIIRNHMKSVDIQIKIVNK